MAFEALPDPTGCNHAQSAHRVEQQLMVPTGHAAVVQDSRGPAELWKVVIGAHFWGEGRQQLHVGAQADGGR